MWLKDLLPHDVDGIRVMSYGYNANTVGGAVEDGFIDYRLHFIQMLENSRQSPEVYLLFCSVRWVLRLAKAIKRRHRDQLFLSDTAQVVF
jgi:hypothetical protein